MSYFAGIILVVDVLSCIAFTAIHIIIYSLGLGQVALTLHCHAETRRDSPQRDSNQGHAIHVTSARDHMIGPHRT